MCSLLGNTFCACALNNLSTNEMHFLAKNSGLILDDSQIDIEYIKNKELEWVRSFDK